MYEALSRNARLPGAAFPEYPETFLLLGQDSTAREVKTQPGFQTTKLRIEMKYTLLKVCCLSS